MLWLKADKVNNKTLKIQGFKADFHLFCVKFGAATKMVFYLAVIAGS